MTVEASDNEVRKFLVANPPPDEVERVVKHLLEWGGTGEFSTALDEWLLSAWLTPHERARYLKYVFHLLIAQGECQSAHVVSLYQSTGENFAKTDLMPRDLFLRGLCAVECNDLRHAEDMLTTLASRNDDQYRYHQRLEAHIEHAKSKSFDGTQDELNKLFSAQELTQIALLCETGSSGLDALQWSPTELRPDAENEPLVTVVMSTCNAQETIEYAIRSLMQQTWSNIELIVVDDNSSDQTVRIVETLASLDPRIKILLNLETRGTYACQNQAVATSTGSFITVLKSDHLAHPQRLERQMHSLLKDSSLLATMSYGLHLTSDLQPVATHPDPVLNFTSLLVRREAFDLLGPWLEIRYAADSEFVEWIEYIFGSNSIEYLPETEILTLVREDSTSLTTKPKSDRQSLFRPMGVRSLLQQSYRRHLQSYADCKHNGTDIADFRSRLPWIPQSAQLNARQSPVSLKVDLVVVGDLSSDGSPVAQLNEIVGSPALSGLRTALVHSVDPWAKSADISSEIWELVASNAGALTIATESEEISAKWLLRLSDANGSGVFHPSARIDAEKTVTDVSALQASSHRAPPNITVVMPFVDPAHYLEEAIRSALDSAKVNVQLLLVKDGGPSAVPKFVSDLVTFDPRVELIELDTNCGPYFARNIALKKLKTPFVSFLDSDDVQSPQRLIKQIEALETHDGAKVVQCLASRWSEDWSQRFNEPRLAYISLVFRKELLAEIGFFDSVQYGGDSELLERVKMRFGPQSVVVLDDELYYARALPTGLTQSPEVGVYRIDKGRLLVDRSQARIDYEQGFREWHRSKAFADDSRINFPQRHRRYKLGNPKQEASPFMGEPVFGSLASFPIRIDQLREAFDSIIGQVDHLFVYLNGYQSTPKFLCRSDVTAIHESHGDLRELGKFVGLSGQPGYHLTLDDDIVYPPDYVETMLIEVERLGRRALVGTHGIRYDRASPSLVLNRTVCHFAEACRGGPVDAVGTGTACYHSSALSMTLEDCGPAGFADLWLSRKAFEMGVPIHSIERQKGWLKSLDSDMDTRIYVVNQRNAQYAEELFIETMGRQLSQSSPDHVCVSKQKTTASRHYSRKQRGSPALQTYKERA